MGDFIRKFTDKFIFGEDPKERNEIQAIARDATHAIYHAGGTVVNALIGNKEKAEQDAKRCADHLAGENRNQISEERRNRSRERRNSLKRKFSN